MDLQRQPALLKEQGYRRLAFSLSLWLAVVYLWLALFYPLICAPYSFDSYIPVSRLNIFDHTITPFPPTTDTHILRPDGATQYLRSSTTLSIASWPIDSREDTSGLAMSFIDGISLPGLYWREPAQPYQTVTLLHTQSYKHFRALPPKHPPRISLI